MKKGLRNISGSTQTNYQISIVSVFLLLLHLNLVSAEWGEWGDGYNSNNNQYDLDNWKCDTHEQCEVLANYRNDDKETCCDDGECREHCLSVGLVILLFVVLPCCGCCLLVATIGTVIYCIVKSGNKSTKGQVHCQENGGGVYPPEPVPYNGTYPAPPPLGFQQQYATPYPPPPSYMPPAQPNTMY